MITARKPTLTARKDSAIMHKKSPVDQWTKYIDKEQIKNAIDIMSMFELDRIYSYDPQPYMDGIHYFLK